MQILTWVNLLMKKDFKNKMTLDYLHKGYDYVLDQMYEFAKDETGAIGITFGSKTSNWKNTK